MREAIAALSAGDPGTRIAGRFLPFWRSRPIGGEQVRATGTARGGLRIEAVTSLDIPRLSLRQDLIADYDADLRPLSCTISARINGRALRVDLEVDADRMMTSADFEGRRRDSTIELDRPPLLLVDNCFAVHALAGLTALASEDPAATYRSIPAAGVLTVAVPGAASLVLGGRDFGVPSLTLNLTRDLQEHVWLRGGWVSRLLIPQAHMGAEWVWGTGAPGGRP